MVNKHFKLEKEFKSVSKAHKHNPTLALLTNLHSARLALNLALTSAAEKSLRWREAHFYIQRNKIGLKLTTKLTPLTLKSDP